MGVVNVTPDSVSGDGVETDVGRALDLGRQLVEAGADVIEIGGVSTQPGANPVASEEELRRVIPAVKAMAGEIGVPVSVDTMRALVAQEALGAGACIVHDVSGLHADPAVARVAAAADAALILGHWARGGWGTSIPRSTDVVEAVTAHLDESIQRACAAGMPAGSIWVDPGLGFGLHAKQSRSLVAGLRRLRTLGRPIVVGPSRKALIGPALNPESVTDWEGAAALVTLAIAAGAQVVRVHDVARLARVARMADALRRA